MPSTPKCASPVIFLIFQPSVSSPVKYLTSSQGSREINGGGDVLQSEIHYVMFAVLAFITEHYGEG